MIETENMWEKIYDVSPELGRTVRKLIDMKYFEGKLMLKPTNLLRFYGTLQERTSLEDICKRLSINYKGTLKDGKYHGYEGQYFYGKLFKKRKVLCDFEAISAQKNKSAERFILSEIKVRTRYKDSPTLLVGLVKSLDSDIDVHA